MSAARQAGEAADLAPSAEGPGAATERAPATPPAEGGRDPHRAAMERAGRLLGARRRSTAEVGDGLLRAGHRAEVVDAVLARLTELGLLDDPAFARQWVEERARAGRAERVLLHELALKGIARDVAEAAVAEAGLDERAAATALVTRHLARVASLPLPTQAARLGGLLARRGYPAEVVEEAVRAVLPPDGWD